MKAPLKFTALALGAAILVSAIYMYRTVQLGRGDAQPVQIDNLNPQGEMSGPAGLAFDPKGDLYVGDAHGVIWKFERGGSPSIYVQLDALQPPSGVRAGGMAFDGQGNLYVAAYGFAGGSVLAVDAGRNVRLFARGIGVASRLLAAGDGSHLWVSDQRSSGRLLRYPLGGATPAQPDLTVDGLKYPAGMVASNDDAVLLTAETYSGNIVQIEFGRETPQITTLANIKGSFSTGSLDSLAFDPRDSARRFLYVSENLRGMFTVLDLQSSPPRVVKRLAASLMGGRPCPASMVIRDGHLYFTDIWACSPFRLMLGYPAFHHHAYRFRLLDLSSIL